MTRQHLTTALLSGAVLATGLFTGCASGDRLNMVPWADVSSDDGHGTQSLAAGRHSPLTDSPAPQPPVANAQPAPPKAPAPTTTAPAVTATTAATQPVEIRLKPAPAPAPSSSELPVTGAEKLVIAPETDKQRIIEGQDLQEFLSRYSLGVADEHQQIAYSAFGYMIIKGKRYDIRYGELVDNQFPGVLIIADRKGEPLRLRQYR